MDKKDKKATFTNEDLTKRFKNNFDLVNYAISLAENMIKTGRDARVKTDTQNRAMQILEEIHQGEDQFDEIFEREPSENNFDGNVPAAEHLSGEKIEKRRYKTAAVILEEVE